MATTQWSQVLAAQDGPETEARTALESLYAYVRHQGDGPEEGQDLTQGYLTELLDKDLLSEVDSAKGRSRAYPLATLRHYLLHKRARAGALKRGEGTTTLSLDGEAAEAGYRGARPAGYVIAVVVACVTTASSPLLATGEIIRSGVPMTVWLDRAEPELHTVVTARVGAVAYSESRTRGHSVAILETEFRRKKVQLREGSILYGYHYSWPGEAGAGPSPDKWCSHLARQQSGPVCMIDRDGDGRMDERSVSENIFRFYLKHMVYELEEPVFRRISRAHRRVPYKRAVMPFDRTYHRGVPMWYYRQEVVYQGMTNGSFNLLVRDVGDAAHEERGQTRGPAREEVSIPQADRGPTLVKVRGVVIEVLDAHDQTIRYRVVSGFQEEDRPVGFSPERSGAKEGSSPSRSPSRSYIEEHSN